MGSKLKYSKYNMSYREGIINYLFYKIDINIWNSFVENIYSFIRIN